MWLWSSFGFITFSNFFLTIVFNILNTFYLQIWYNFELDGFKSNSKVLNNFIMAVVGRLVSLCLALAYEYTKLIKYFSKKTGNFQEITKGRQPVTSENMGNITLFWWVWRFFVFWWIFLVLWLVVFGWFFLGFYVFYFRQPEYLHCISWEVVLWRSVTVTS